MKILDIIDKIKLINLLSCDNVEIVDKVIYHTLYLIEK